MLWDGLSTGTACVSAGFSTLSTDSERIVPHTSFLMLTTLTAGCSRSNSLTSLRVLGYNHAALRPLVGRLKEETL